jgi:hypothetical protein
LNRHEAQATVRGFVDLLPVAPGSAGNTASARTSSSLLKARRLIAFVVLLV